MKNKNIVLIIVLIAIAGAIYYFNSTKVPVPEEIAEEPVQDAVRETGKTAEQIEKAAEPAPSDYIMDEEAIKQKSLLFQEAPELTGIAGYINTDPDIKIKSLKGKVVLVDFWTYTCINCIRTLPYLKSWDEKYRGKGLQIVGVHTPEFKFEQEYENVKAAVEKYQIKYPIVQDNAYATWRAYNNHYWPHKYLVDIDGFIRWDHIGEGAYDQAELFIQELLNERMERLGERKVIEDMSKPSETIEVDFGKVNTPEIYFGFEFTRGNFGNSGGLPANQIIDYSIPDKLNDNDVYLEGKWKVNEDNVELVSEEGKIILKYDAKAVNIVAGSGQGSEVEVLIDNKNADSSNKGSDITIKDGKGVSKIRESKLYNLVDYDYGKHKIEIRIDGKGFKIYTFTFG